MMLGRSMPIDQLPLMFIRKRMTTRPGTILGETSSISAGRDTARFSRNGGKRTLLAPVDTLRLELLARLAATAASRAARAKLKDESEQTETRSDPHKDHHLGTDMRPDVDARIGGCEDIGEDLEHNGRDG